MSSTTLHRRNPMGASAMVNTKANTNVMAAQQLPPAKPATGPKNTYEEEKYSRDPLVASAMGGLEAAATSLSLFNMALREAVKAGQRADSYQHSRMGRMFGAAKKDLAEAEELMTRLGRMTDC